MTIEQTGSPFLLDTKENLIWLASSSKRQNVDNSLFPNNSAPNSVSSSELSLTFKSIIGFANQKIEFQEFFPLLLKCVDSVKVFLKPP